MTEQMTPSEREKQMGRLRRVADTLDARFNVPGLGIPVGWDSILGLIPGVGDAITVGPAVWTIYHARRMGARKRVLARMGVNTGIDAVLGGIPLLGDAFDLFFKSHRRNIALLEREVARIEARHASEIDRKIAEGQTPPDSRSARSGRRTGRMSGNTV